MLSRLCPPGFRQDFPGRLGHFRHLGFRVPLDQAHIFREFLPEGGQLTAGILLQLGHFALPGQPVLLQLHRRVRPELRDLLLGLHPKPLQFRGRLVTGLGVLDGPEGDVLLQLVVAHGVQRPDLFDGRGPHLLKLRDQVRVNAPGGELTQNILPLAKLLDLTLQILHQRFTADRFLLRDLVKEAVGLVQALGPGLHRVLILLVQGFDVPFQLLVDGLDLVGIGLLQLDAPLVGGFLNALHVGDVLLLGLVNFLLQPVDLPVQLLPLLGALGVPALDPLVGGQLVGQAQTVVILFLLDPVHGVLIGLVHKLVAEGEDLPVQLHPFLAALQIPGLHPLIGGQLLLGAQALVILLLLDPVQGGLVGGGNQFILNPIDLPVDLHPLLTAGPVLLLEVFPSGQLVHQAQLAVILLLVDPILKGIDALLADGDHLVDHAGGGLCGRDDAVVDADGQTLAHVFAQMDEFPGGGVAVQRLLCRFQSGQAQASAGGPCAAQLGVDAVDKALPGVLSGGLELRLHAVDVGYGGGEHRPHRVPHRSGVGRDGCFHGPHHIRCRCPDGRDLPVHNVRQRLDHRLHGPVCHGEVGEDGAADGGQHTGHGFVDRVAAVVESTGKAGDAGVSHLPHAVGKAGQTAGVDPCGPLSQLQQAPYLCDHVGHPPGVDAGDLAVIVLHGRAELGNIPAKGGQRLVSAEPLVKQTAVRQAGGEVGEGLRRVGRGRHHVRLHIADGLRIGGKVRAKQRQVIAKGGQVGPSGKEGQQAARVGKGLCQLHQGHSGGGGAFHRFRPNIRHSVAVGFHGRAEGDDARRKSGQVLASVEEFHHTAYQGKGLLQPRQRLGGSG